MERVTCWGSIRGLARHRPYDRSKGPRFRTPVQEPPSQTRLSAFNILREGGWDRAMKSLQGSIQPSFLRAMRTSLIGHVGPRILPGFAHGRLRRLHAGTPHPEKRCTHPVAPPLSTRLARLCMRAPPSTDSHQKQRLTSEAELCDSGRLSHQPLSSDPWRPLPVDSGKAPAELPPALGSPPHAALGCVSFPFGVAQTLAIACAVCPCALALHGRQSGGLGRCSFVRRVRPMPVESCYPSSQRWCCKLAHEEALRSSAPRRPAPSPRRLHVGEPPSCERAHLRSGLAQLLGVCRSRTLQAGASKQR